MPVDPVPAGYHTVTPYLLVEHASQYLDFLFHAFGAETIRKSELDGVIMNAEVRLGDSMLMLAEARGDYRAAPASCYLYVPDTDAVYEQALNAGAISLMPPSDQFYGDRNAGVSDTAGNTWWIATHIEDVSDEEINRRAAARE